MAFVDLRRSVCQQPVFPQHALDGRSIPDSLIPRLQLAIRTRSIFAWYTDFIDEKPLTV